MSSSGGRGVYCVMARRGERRPAKRLVSGVNLATRLYSRSLEYSLPRRDIVVIGASSGGVEALMRLAAGLPADLPAALFVVVHFPPMAPSILPRLLDRSGPLEAVKCEDGMLVRPGRIYVACPDRHLLVEEGRVRLAQGPK